MTALLMVIAYAAVAVFVFNYDTDRTARAAVFSALWLPAIVMVALLAILMLACGMLEDFE